VENDGEGMYNEEDHGEEYDEGYEEGDEEDGEPDTINGLTFPEMEMAGGKPLSLCTSSLSLLTPGARP